MWRKELKVLIHSFTYKASLLILGIQCIRRLTTNIQIYVLGNDHNLQKLNAGLIPLETNISKSII